VTSERWQRVEALFEQTLEAPAAERPQFLHGIDDDELRREVESLNRIISLPAKASRRIRFRPARSLTATASSVRSDAAGWARFF
jgi:hypothetical protein